MSDPSSHRAPEPDPHDLLVPHPDTLADVRAGLDEAEAGQVLSEAETLAHLRGLLGETPR